jgi:hypothetical protein
MQKFLVILGLLLSTLITGCSAHRAAQSFISKDGVPKDLTSPEYVLLVMKLKEPDWRPLNRGLVKDLAKHKYPAIAVSKEDLASGKYDDTNKYRYLLHAYDNAVVRRSAGSTDVFFEFYFTDRKEKRDLPSTGYKSTYRTGIHYVLAYYE